jgi:hypothetical protein
MPTEPRFHVSLNTLEERMSNGSIDDDTTTRINPHIRS